MMDRKIDFMIIGAQKAGTTSLNDYLAQHPDIYLSLAKDTHYFVRDDLYTQGEALLDVLHKGLGKEQIIGGASVQLMYFPYAPERLYAHNPHMKIIVVLRNPIDRAYSAYWYARRQGWEPCRTFEEALEKEPLRIRGTFKEQAELTCLRHGHYWEQLIRYRETFPHDNIYIVLFDDLKNSKAMTVDEIFKWLGVRTDGIIIDVTARSNEAGMPKMAWLQNFIMSYDTWYRHLARKIISPAMRNYFSRNIIIKLSEKNIRPYRYPPMNDKTRMRLADYFKPHNEKLAELIDRDLSHWQ